MHDAIARGVERGRRPEVIADRYVVESAIAEGGMGEVVLARDRRLGRRVAIKRCRRGVPGGGERLRREARLTARLGHRAIVAVLDLIEGAGGDAGGDAIVMPYLSGPSLRDLHGLGAVRPGGVVRIVRELASALSCIHDHQIVHLDLKLENVLLAADGQPVVIDFGIARIRQPGGDADFGDTTRCDADRDDRACELADITGEHYIEGTPRVMSPEQIAGHEVDSRSDLFSLGVLAYELASATTPFATGCDAQTLARVLGHRPPPLHELDPAIPRALSDLVDQLLEKEPALRPQSAAEVSLRLAQVDATAPA